MSRRHTDWYWSHLNELQKVTFIDPTGKERSFLGHGLLLIGWLCDQARDDDGTVYASTREMSEQTAISQPSIKKLLAAFQQVGWLTKTGESRYMGRGTPTPVYEVSLCNAATMGNQTPKTKKRLQEKALETALGVSPLVSQVVSPMTPLETVKPLQDTELTENSVLYPYPYPEPDPKPEPKSSRTDLAGAREGRGQGKGDLEHLVSLCVHQDLDDRPPKGTPGAPLLDKMQREYRRLVPSALQQFPNAEQADQVTWCVYKRHHEQPPRELLKALRPRMANCQKCNGAGIFYEYPNGTEGGTKVVRCDCETLQLETEQLTEQLDTQQLTEQLLAKMTQLGA